MGPEQKTMPLSPVPLHLSTNSASQNSIELQPSNTQQCRSPATAVVARGNGHFAWTLRYEGNGGDARLGSGEGGGVTFENILCVGVRRLFVFST